MIDSNEVRRRKLVLFVFLLADGPLKQKHSENLQLLKDLQFPVNPESKSCKNIDEVIEFCRYWELNKDELPFEIDGIVVIDDYGHHPVEISAVLESARGAYKGKIVAVVQPHRVSRLKNLFEDFCALVIDLAIC